MAGAIPPGAAPRDSAPGPAAHSPTLAGRLTALRAQGRARADQLPLRPQRDAFREWRHTRPFWAGLLLVLGGLELMAIPLSPLTVLVSLGLGGIAAIGIGIALVVAGLFLWFTPRARHYVSINALLLSVLSFAATNLGGFLIGMVLGIVGSAMGFGWTPRETPATQADAGFPPDIGPPPRPGTGAGPDATGGAPDRETAPDRADDRMTGPGDGAEGASPQEEKKEKEGGGTGETAEGKAAGAASGGAERRLAGGTTVRTLGLLVPVLVLVAAVGVPARGAPMPRSSGHPPAPTPAAPGAPHTAATQELTAALAPTPGEAKPTGDAGPTTAFPQLPSQAPQPSPEGSDAPTPAAKGPGFPVAATPPTITTTKFSPHGFIVAGVTELPTAKGPLKVMVLHMQAASLTDYRMKTRDGSPELDLGADSLELKGHVTLYLSRFKGCVEGLLCLTFTPDRLPVPPLVPPFIFLTKVEADQALVTADSIETDGLTLTPHT
ncbi:DUF6114 domain-containing protein [Streptomyces zagrosensis]|uniref:Uncharacterized protein n=1 Tax=Streptomyces zagrosensis TaxID=1042984 RepID=A0A7W9QFQ1_9ACTN|nr:DUF6114 domain-containing protein [Streptomyces zagrosensis]MBB5938367.1 hypothetical protein [Streptomyces zagrosensis]